MRFIHSKSMAPCRHAKVNVMSRLVSPLEPLAWWQRMHQAQPSASLAIRRWRLDSIPKTMRKEFGLKENEDAVFCRLDSGAYRDGVRFKDGRKLSLQRFEVGCGVSVKSLLEKGFILDPAARETAYVGA